MSSAQMTLDLVNDGRRAVHGTVAPVVGLMVCNAAADCESTSCHHRTPHVRGWDCENTDICFNLFPERETTCVDANDQAHFRACSEAEDM